MGHKKQGLEPAYVEFSFRVHANGRRERTATVYAKRPDGEVVPVTGKLSGSLGEFALGAVEETLRLGQVPAPGSRRRVAIEPRSEFGGRRWRR